ncbi:MAG: exodeoxyribonuclease VII small subunit [Chromatiales bacterium]
MVKKAVQEEIPFEDALSELESLVETMEKGELSLEESLASFERGVALTRLCQQALKAAEQKIEILSANSSEAELESFQGD